ncbi:ABC transporter ATP-binding protein [Micromonospora carbonacea]|uniref:Putative ABC transport system ATP-binding protein n=1 Tax=Micromonospora carbonacea TaxID=47853 RepID=A0A1C4YN50_9ACTN|nr:ABC transporter ATP-binding protein [Micromonospora carbonacea]SCF22114.1 putative ABC transport system ATP-binding protein [Micromonospora carbonacea]
MTGPRVDGGAAATGPRAGGGATAAADRGTPGEALLVAEELHRAFGPTPALAGASLTVRAGEVLAVLGPSGSGKSTLLHCLAGIVRPDSGRVLYQGADLTTLSDRELSALRRGQFGFVFQFGQLVPELTCLENVALPLRLERVGRREAERRAAEWLDRLEVTEVAGKRPGEVSGGQGQRVAVARALVTGPRVIFADEPTGALDSLHGERVMRLLTGAARDTGAAVVLVTHEARVAAYSDREVVVRDGRTRSLEAAA